MVPRRSKRNRLWTALLCRSRWAVGALLILFLTTTGWARPRVGLVLGGGSARGLAHIGVFEWLEANRIPVDYVVGTSMGALVGSLYSMGYTPREMRDLVARLNWEQLFSGTAPYADLQFRRKQDAADYPVRFEVGLKHGFRVPSGLNTGQFIALLFQRLSLPYSNLTDFDQLPTPFRCVAVDLETGNEVLFSRGPLWRALRSTMAIPGVFTPAHVDSRLLIDGGILNNLPVNVARSLGADIVIAVDVESPLEGRESLESLLGIIDQTVTIMMLQNLRRSIREADLVLSPDLKGFEALDFRKWADIIRVGEAAAASRGAMLRSLALSESEWRDYLDERNGRRRTGAPTVAGLEVTGVGPEMAVTLARRLAGFADGAVDPARLEPALTRIYGQGQYASVGYEVVEQNGTDKLDIRIRRQTYGPPFIRFGLNIDGSNIDNVGFGVRARTTFFDLGRLGSEARIDLGLGRPDLASAEYYLPVAGPWFVAPRAYGARDTTGVFSGDDRVAEFLETRTGVGFDAGYGVGSTHSEVRLGYDLFEATGKVRVGEPLLERTDGRVQFARLQWQYDGLDEPVIPSRGLRTSWRWRHYLEFPQVTGGLDQVDAELLFFQPLTRRNRLFFRSSAGTTLNRDAPFLLSYALGGPFRLGAYERARFRGSRFFYGSTGFLHRFVESSLLLGGSAYIGAWYGMGAAFDRHQDAEIHHVGSAAVLVDSVVGPLFLGGSWGESGRFRFYFGIGTLF
ncbi:MAG: patatin-like phospholipase family protein [Acidobacteriota bacterium]